MGSRTELSQFLRIFVSTCVCASSRFDFSEQDVGYY